MNEKTLFRSSDSMEIWSRAKALLIRGGAQLFAAAAGLRVIVDGRSPADSANNANLFHFISEDSSTRVMA
jgi:hypothetical protein